MVNTHSIFYTRHMTCVTVWPCHTMLFQWQGNTTSLPAGLEDSWQWKLYPFSVLFQTKNIISFFSPEEVFVKTRFHFTSVSLSSMKAFPIHCHTFQTFFFIFLVIPSLFQKWMSFPPHLCPSSTIIACIHLCLTQRFCLFWFLCHRQS